MRDQNEENQPISTVGILTCSRPKSLQTCLSGLIRNLENHDRSPRILVIDDSRKKDISIENKEITECFRQKYKGNIEYLDRWSRRDMAGELARKTDMTTEAALFTLCGDESARTTVGSARNTLIWKTKGEKILSMDDDTICDLFALKEKENNCIYTLESPYEYRFLKNNDSIPDEFESFEGDLLGIHEHALGKKVRDIMGNTCPEHAREQTITMTNMGSTGDSPMQSHIPLLFLPQVYEKLKDMTPADYEMLKSTRHMSQVPFCPTVYEGPMCISMILGIDNRGNTPLFMPVERAQDLVFGTILWQTFPLHKSYYIPIMIRHKRPGVEISATVPYNIVSEMTKMNRVVSSIISDESAAMDIDLEKNLKRIGEKLVSISSDPEGIFKVFMEEQCKKHLNKVREYLEYLISIRPEAPEFWIHDIRSMIEMLRSPNPKDFLSDVQSLDKFRTWLSLYGKSLTNWS